jgi:hypothetical protein
VVDAALDRTDNVSATSPSYTGNDLGPAAATTQIDLKIDPWAPETTAYMATNDGLYKTTTMDQAAPTWSLVLSAADILSMTGRTYQGVGHVVCSIHQEDYVGMFYGAGGNRIYYSFSEDGGATWTSAIVSSNFSTVSHLTGSVADREGGALNTLYAAHNTQSGRQLFKSTNKGASWVVTGAMAGSSSSESVVVHVPYKDNAAAQVVFIGLSSGSWVTTNGGSSFTALPAATVAKGGLYTYTQDRQRVYHWRSNNTFWTSTNGGSSWTQQAASGIAGTVRAAGGFPNDPDRHYALTTSGIFISMDGGATWQDKTGDWAHGFTITQYRGGTIVPLWTE